VQNRLDTLTEAVRRTIDETVDLVETLGERVQQKET